MMNKINNLNLRYINYIQRNCQNRYRSDSRDRRISFSGRIQCGQDYIDKPRYKQSYRNDIRRGNLKADIRENQTYKGQNYRGGYKGIIEMKIMTQVEIDPEVGCIQKVPEEMTEVVVVDWDQVQELVQIETEYDAINRENTITLLKTVQL